MSLIKPMLPEELRLHILEMTGEYSPCDGCHNEATCRTGKACDRFRHYVLHGNIIRVRSKTPSREIYTSLFRE